MSRLSAAAPASRLWDDIESAVRGFGKLFHALPATSSGLEALEREHSRIVLTSRHWLIG